MIKAFIIVSMTADGKIARNAQHAATWTSKEDKKFFVERTNQAGVMIMGQTTYETIGRPLPGRLTVVYSRKEISGVETTTLEPKALLEDLEKRGYKEVAICGGSTIYTMFIKAKLVDTLYVTIEPLLFGEGMGIFNEEINVPLQLRSFKNLSENVLLLEYDI
ncbi:MAG: dihydrofolate reductase family protein [Patescibacteria group bacterium]